MQDEPISSDGAFYKVYRSVALHLWEHRGFSIDDIIEHLEEKGLLNSEKDGNFLDARRLLVFAIWGWPARQTTAALRLHVTRVGKVPNNIDTDLLADP